MTPAEERAMDEEVERIVADAPRTIPPHVLEMLRRDGCPIFGRERRQAAS